LRHYAGKAGPAIGLTRLAPECLDRTDLVSNPGGILKNRVSGGERDMRKNILEIFREAPRV
jgi:hypothetical protein